MKDYQRKFDKDCWKSIWFLSKAKNYCFLSEANLINKMEI